MPNYTTVIAGKGVTFSTPEPLTDSELSAHLSAIQDNMQADQPNLTATPPQGQAPPTGELQTPPSPTTLQSTPNSPLSSAMERYGLQGPNFTPSAPPQQGNGTTFASDLPSIIGSVVLPMLLGGRAGGGVRGMAARTGAGVAGALAGSPLGQVIQQRIQGVPGPPLSERATNAGTGAAVAGPFAELLGMIGSKIARPLGVVPGGQTAVQEAERVGIKPSPVGITGSPMTKQLLNRKGVESIARNQSIGMEKQIANKITAAGGPIKPNTLPGEFTTTLKANIRTHLNKFNRTPQAMSVEANRIKNITGIDPMAVTESQLLTKLKSNPNQLGQLAHHVPSTVDTIRQAWLTRVQEQVAGGRTPAGISPPAAFMNEWTKLTPFSRKAIFGNTASSMERLAKVIGASSEAHRVAGSSVQGSTLSYWQPIAAVIGTAEGAVTGRMPSPTFLGTTAALTGIPSIFSRLVQTKTGIRWLVGAYEASKAGRLIGRTAEAFSRSLVQIIGQEGASAGTPTLPVSPQTPPTPPAGMATPRAMTANKFPTRQLAP